MQFSSLHKKINKQILSNYQPKTPKEHQPFFRFTIKSPGTPSCCNPSTHQFTFTKFGTETELTELLKVACTCYERLWKCSCLNLVKVN